MNMKLKAFFALAAITIGLTPQINAQSTYHTVVAWGANLDGQTTVPSGLDGVVAIAAGSSNSLALKSDM